MKKSISLGVLTAIALAGCVSGASNYSEPSAASVTTRTNSVVVNKPMAAAWQASVPKLGKEFFVINTIDKSSGIINISYSGDPAAYINCGTIHSEVTDIHGTRVYDFPAAKADQVFEGTGWVGVFHSPRLTHVVQHVSLEGRMNIVFEDVDASHTRITVSTRYIVDRRRDAQIIPEGNSSHSNDSISFNTGGSASFPQVTAATPTTCRATNKFESDIIDLIRS